VSAPRQDRTALAPSTAAGWARLRDRLEADAAIAARDKALILAAVAAVRGRDELLRRESARLAELAGAGMVADCAAVLTVARGREVADRFAGAAGVSLDWDVDAPAAPTDSDVGAAREYFAPAPAEAPPPISLLAEHAPGVLVGYRELRAGIYDQGSLEPQLVELLLFAISAADYQAGHAAVHAGKAVEQGAAEPQLVEAGLCAIAAAGMASWLIAATVITQLEPTKEVPA
jgi:alkylhydroperoxidase/carboxymuconolactone decarboxylase family protein YurZ